MVVLCGIVMGALNVGFFLLGFYLGKKQKDDNGITVTDDNRDFIEEMNRWRNFHG